MKLKYVSKLVKKPISFQYGNLLDVKNHLRDRTITGLPNQSTIIEVLNTSQPNLRSTQCQLFYTIISLELTVIILIFYTGL